MTISTSAVTSSGWLAAYSGVSHRPTVASATALMPSARTMAARAGQPYAGPKNALVHSRARRPTRPGLRVAMLIDTIAPRESPTKCARSIPASSSAASTDSPRRSIVSGPSGGALPP